MSPFLKDQGILVIGLLPFLLILIFSGCVSSVPRITPDTTRKVSVEKTDSDQKTVGKQPSQTLDSIDLPKTVENDQPDSVIGSAGYMLLTEESQERFEEVKRLFDSGHKKAARQNFERILANLRESELNCSMDSRFDRLYYEFVEKMQVIEVASLLDINKYLTPELEEDVFEEIIRHNIFSLEVDPKLKNAISNELEFRRFDLPMMVNKSVLRFITYYVGQGYEWTAHSLKRSGRYMNYFREVFKREEIPLDLIYLPHVESLYKATAYSRANASGIWQFIAGTATRYNLKVGWWVDERNNVELSTVAAAQHLRDLYGEFQDWYLALAAYNAGPGRVRRILRKYGNIDYWDMVERKLLPRESRHYVPAILASILIFKNPSIFGFDVEPDEPLRFENVVVSHQFDLRVIAEEIDIEPELLAKMNPELRRKITPDTSYQLRVPMGKGELAARAIAKIPSEKRLRVRHHKVQKGDTLWHLARGYRTSINAIVHVNRIRNPNYLKLGRTLVIPMNPPHNRSKKNSSDLQEGRYTVRKGDSLYKIANLLGCSVERLASLNRLKGDKVIYPGQNLKLP